jgi:hypothetical protein
MFGGKAPNAPRATKLQRAIAAQALGRIRGRAVGNDRLAFFRDGRYRSRGARDWSMIRRASEGASNRNIP